MATTMMRYEPDYAVSPGEVLEERLEAKGMNQVELAKRCKIPPKIINQIIHGKYRITPDIAIRFERITGVSASIWNNLEASFRLHKAQEEAQANLSKMVERTKKFPLKELVKRGAIQSYKNMLEASENLLSFFAVGNYEAWDMQYKELSVQFRHSPSFKSSPEAVASWLRIGELQAEQIDTAPYDRKQFASSLTKIRTLTSEQPEKFESVMKELCMKSGVAVVLVSEFAHTHLHGATRWLNKDKAMLILSLRYKSNDQFWFSFFHEAAHILLHGKKKFFLDEKDKTGNHEEGEANDFASNMLIPKAEYAKFHSQGVFNKAAVLTFAKTVDIAPGIVVGRLQHDKAIPFNRFNDLKQQFTLIESL